MCYNIITEREKQKAKKERGTTMKQFNELPESVKNEIKDTLKAYDDVDVYYENGKYHFGLYLQANYAKDHEYIGCFKASDIYTEEERILNYVNEFHAYPIQYKGKRDYTIIKDYNAKYKMVNGNIEVV